MIKNLTTKHGIRISIDIPQNEEGDRLQCVAQIDVDPKSSVTLTVYGLPVVE